MSDNLLTDEKIKEGNRFLTVSNDYDSAINLYKIALELSPNFAKAYFNIGVALYCKQNYVNAIEYYEKALENDISDIAKTYWYIGNAYMANKYLLEAIESFSKSINFKPTYAFAYFSMAMCYIELEDISKAIECFELAVKYKPDFALAYARLGNIYHVHKQYKKALKNYKKTIYYLPNFSNVYLGMSNIYFRKFNLIYSFYYSHKFMQSRKFGGEKAELQWSIANLLVINPIS